MLMHQAMAATLDKVVEQIKQIQHEARATMTSPRPRWPMIVLRSPKGWTGPRWSMASISKAAFAHIRCRCLICAQIRSICKLLEAWLKSYRPEELFDERVA